MNVSFCDDAAAAVVVGGGGNGDSIHVGYILIFY
jgi:hypothetical protein